MAAFRLTAILPINAGNVRTVRPLFPNPAQAGILLKLKRKVTGMKIQQVGPESAAKSAA
jgi:hypothetical protein